MDSLMDALADTGKLLPFLAGVYVVVGFLEYRYGGRMGNIVTRFGALGPVAGALLGCIPQCGFSVVAAALYVKRLISVGTLLAVFISTSDEAVPVLLSMPERAGMVWSLIGLKAIIAIIAGISLDLFLKRRLEAPGEDMPGHCGCCDHGVSGTPSAVKTLVLHPLWHTAKISFFIFVLTFALNLVVAKAGEGRIAAFFLTGSVFQPFAAAFVGLIPNCFASVFLAQFYAKGMLSFGSLVAGLSAGAGLGLLVLARENRNVKDTLFIVGILLGVSIFTGLIIQVFG